MIRILVSVVLGKLVGDAIAESVWPEGAPTWGRWGSEIGVGLVLWQLAR